MRDGLYFWILGLLVAALMVIGAILEAGGH